MIRLPIALLVSLAILAARANAEPANLVKASSGYLYFNRVRANMAVHDAELSDCFGAAGFHAPTRSSPMIEMGIAGNAIENGIHNMMLSGWARAAADIDVELCMVVRGWRLMRLSDRQGRPLASLDQAALANEISQWVGAETPPGQVVRFWRNDAADLQTIVDRSPSGASRVLLSERALGPTPEAPSDPIVWGQGPRQGHQLAPINLATVQSIPDTQALVIIAVSGRTAARSVIGVGRNFPDEETLEQFEVDLRGTNSVGGVHTRVAGFFVPQGRWRILAARSNTDFCLGAPAFEATAGSVIFLGAFDISAERLVPDTTPDALHHYLPALPATLPPPQPAAWENGTRSVCWAFPVSLLAPNYALEFDGSPYRAGYAWAGATGAH